MENVFIIEFSAYHHYLNDEDGKDYEDKKTFGVFDTELRGLAYLRRFLKENDVYGYYDKVLKTTEKEDGVCYAEATRRYKNDRLLVTERLTMRRFKFNDLQSPCEEILDIYCG